MFELVIVEGRIVYVVLPFINTEEQEAGKPTNNSSPILFVTLFVKSFELVTVTNNIMKVVNFDVFGGALVLF